MLTTSLIKKGLEIWPSRIISSKILKMHLFDNFSICRNFIKFVQNLTMKQILQFLKCLKRQNFGLNCRKFLECQYYQEMPL